MYGSTGTLLVALQTKMIKVKSKSPEETRELAEKLVNIIKKPAIILLNGDLGAGKTFFVKAFTEATGSNDETSSPSFSLVNRYNSPKGPIYHLDLYRIADYDELFEIGLDDILNEDALTFIEWPDIAEIKNPDYIITINNLGGDTRLFTFEGNNLEELEDSGGA